MSTSVYVSLIEVKPLNGCELDPDEINGAFLRCYVSANNQQNAIAKIKDALAKDFFDVVNIEWCVDNELTEWDNPNNQEGEKYIKKALSSGGVVYSEFHVWNHDAPDSIS